MHVHARRELIADFDNVRNVKSRAGKVRNSYNRIHCSGITFLEG